MVYCGKYNLFLMLKIEFMYSFYSCNWTILVWNELDTVSCWVFLTNWLDYTANSGHFWALCFNTHVNTENIIWNLSLTTVECPRASKWKRLLVQYDTFMHVEFVPEACQSIRSNLILFIYKRKVHIQKRWKHTYSCNLPNRMVRRWFDISSNSVHNGIPLWYLANIFCTGDIDTWPKSLKIHCSFCGKQQTQTIHSNKTQVRNDM